jgi:hypothetical protein
MTMRYEFDSNLIEYKSKIFTLDYYKVVVRDIVITLDDIGFDKLNNSIYLIKVIIQDIPENMHQDLVDSFNEDYLYSFDEEKKDTLIVYLNHNRMEFKFKLLKTLQIGFIIYYYDKKYSLEDINVREWQKYTN